MNEQREQEPPTSVAPGSERRATVRIDATPGGKNFQGVWLELAGGTKWVVDYRPRVGWTWFADQEVLVEGSCYQPFGQAIMATHFRVDRMRFANEERGRHPYLSIGPEKVYAGEIATEGAPPGSKLAGTTRVVFRSDDGAVYPVVTDREVDVRRAKVRARVVEPDMSYTARTNGPDLWIVDVLPDDYEEDPATANKPVPCP